ncbi:hypothetical protein SHAb15599_00121 [Acinetobacter phage SH-Ab 15599]|nr:hypothetical protein SHAb15599_00121 [Acinetobacter phage SH-Ab 15599]
MEKSYEQVLKVIEAATISDMTMVNAGLMGLNSTQLTMGTVNLIEAKYDIDNGLFETHGKDITMVLLQGEAEIQYAIPSFKSEESNVIYAKAWKSKSEPNKLTYKTDNPLSCDEYKIEKYELQTAQWAVIHNEVFRRLIIKRGSKLVVFEGEYSNRDFTYALFQVADNGKAYNPLDVTNFYEHKTEPKFKE